MTNHNIQSKAKEFINKARRWMPTEDSRFYAVRYLSVPCGDPGGTTSPGLGEGAQAPDAPVDKFRDWQENTNSIFCSRPLAGLRQQMEVSFYME
jgi:hypothetical protein